MIAPVSIRGSSREISRSRARSGAVTVEFAVCLPMILALVFGSIEAANAVFLQQALTVAAYEAGNVASAMGGSSDSAMAQASAVFQALGVKSATVTVSPLQETV